MTITQRFMDSLKPTKKDVFHRDDLLRGFAVKQSAGGTVTFIVEAKVNGQSKRRTVGRHPALSVKEAREKARPMLVLMYDGIDPKAEKAKQKARDAALGTSLRSVLSDYQVARSLAKSTIRDQTNSFNAYFSDWMDKPIRDITRKDVERRFIKLKDSSGKATAAKAIRYLSAVMNYAMADEVEDGVYLLSGNPCDVIREKKFDRTIKKREGYLDEHDVRNLMDFHLTPNVGDFIPDYKPVNQSTITFVLLLLYTGIRKNEGLSLRWSDVDFKNEVFVLRDTKNKTDHIVPMVGFVTDLLEKMKEVSGEGKFVFPAKKDGRHLLDPRKQIARLQKYTGVKFSLHDLRRTFATHATIAGADHNLLARSLNHKSGYSITDGYVATRVDLVRPVFENVADQYGYYYHDGTGKAQFKDGKMAKQDHLNEDLDDEV
ncbi:MAG: tyrosine-type recombinase/integrase [Rhodobacteraceae bacterium]|nr:tyrosine-type recombinase/integrase [Paracoccaceae bacterium]